MGTTGDTVDGVQNVEDAPRDLLTLNGDNLRTGHCLDVQIKMYSHLKKKYKNKNNKNNKNNNTTNQAIDNGIMVVDGKDTNISINLSKLSVTSTPLIRDLLSILPGKEDQPHLSPTLNPYVPKKEDVLSDKDENENDEDQEEEEEDEEEEEEGEEGEEGESTTDNASVSSPSAS